MKNQLFFLFTALAILALSCKKNADDPIPTVQADYFQLKVGNYWIYEGYRVDSNNVAISTGLTLALSSCHVLLPVKPGFSTGYAALS